MTTKFSATGLVLGYFWGGGSGAYDALRIEADTKEELLKTAHEMLENNSLDAGMGFERLTGGKLLITKTDTINIDGRDFVNKEYEEVFIGELTDKQVEFLDDCFMVD